MVDTALLSGIMNPAIADVGEAVTLGRNQREVRQRREQRDETQKISGEILAKAFGATSASKMVDLAAIDSKAALELSKALNIPVNEKERMAKMIGDVTTAAMFIESGDIEGAAKYAAEGADFLAGVGIEPAQYMETIGMLTSEDPAQVKEASESIIALRDEFVSKGLVPSATGEKFSAKTDTLEDGTVIQTTTTGRILVNGQIVTAEERQDIVKRAADEGIRIQEARSTGRGQSTAAVKRSEAAFDQIEAIKGNILNIDEGIRLIDEGAGTGAIMSRLPSVKTASVELDNLQGRLGLDVLKTTTFGALSASELAFALDTALPQKLKGPALRDWLVRKKEAQLKLSTYLTELALFLGTPGNTTTDFLQKKQLEQLQAEKDTPPETAPATNAPNVGRFIIEEIE